MRVFMLLAIWFTLPGPPSDDKPLTSEDAPCFAEVSLGSQTRANWLTLKRTNLDSCAFEPFDTLIFVTADLEPRVVKTSKGWEITFTLPRQ